MKKLVIFLLALILMFALCACGPSPTGFAEDYSLGENELPIIPAIPVTETPVFAVEKHPTSETVEVGGKAKFISYASIPASTKWHFKSPTSGISYTASGLHSLYPSLIIDGHNTNTLTLSNIPADLNGFEIYAVLTASDGKLQKSDSAILTVNAPNIKITKHPYSENNIIVGRSTSFIAHAENATSVVWYATKGEKTLLASELSLSECPGIEIYDYDKDKLILRNVPFSVSGWSFFACFDGANGPIYTEKAIITVISEPYTPSPKYCPPPYIPYCPPVHPRHNPCNPCSYESSGNIVLTADMRPASVPKILYEETIRTTSVTITHTISSSPTPPNSIHHCGLVCE